MDGPEGSKDGNCPAGAAAGKGPSAGWCLILLGIAIALFYWPVLFDGKSFWFRDTMSYYYPEALLTGGALAQGRTPLWEPRIGLGYPYHADPHSMVFYPLAPLLALGSFPRIYAIFTVLHVWLAAAGVFCLTRRLGASVGAALLGGSVIAFAGYAVSVTSLTTLLRGMAWAPWCWAVFEGYLQSGRRTAWLLAGALLAVEGSGTDPQYLLFTVLGMLLLPWVRPQAVNVPWRRWAGGLAGALTVALLLLAGTYLPLAELALESGRLAKVGAAETATFAVDPWQLGFSMVPPPFPNPAAYEYLGGHRGLRGPFHPDIYWGLPILALACAGAMANRGGLLLALVAFASVAMALGEATPLFPAMNRTFWLVGLFRFPAKYMLVTALLVPILAVTGFDAIRKAKGAGRPAFAGVLGLGFLAALGGICLSLARGESMANGFLGISGDPLHPLAPLAQAVASGWIAGFAVVLALAAGTSVVAGLFSSGESDMTAWRQLLVGLVCVGQLVWSTSRGLPVTSDERVVGPRPAAVAALAPGERAPGMPPPRFVSYRPRSIVIEPGRTLLDHFAADNELMTSLRGTLWGLDSLISGLSIAAPAERALEGLFLESSPEERDRLAAACGAELALRREKGRGIASAAGMRQATEAAGTGVAFRRLDNPTPRVFLAGRAWPAAAGATVATTAAILGLPWEAPYEPLPRMPAETLALGARGHCRLLAYEDAGLAVEFETEAPALLVVLDGHYPGWQAWVDGQPRPIVRVAGLFRGVRVAGGERRLQMLYRPLPLRAGAGITAIACAMLLLFTVRGQRPANGFNGHKLVSQSAEVAIS